MKLGYRIRKLRLENSMSQNDLGKQIGVPQTTLSGWERGEGCPNAFVLPGLAAALGVTVSDLLGEQQREVS